MSYSGSGHPYGHYGPPQPGQWPPPYPPAHPPAYPPPHKYRYASTHYPQPYYVPWTMMIPVPTAPMLPPPANSGQPIYVTNYIYNEQTIAKPTHTIAQPEHIIAKPDHIIAKPEHEEVNVVNDVDPSRIFEWVSTTALMASTLPGHPVIGGHEGWDGSPLWVIRAMYNGDLIPGQYSVRHNSASVAYNGQEISVQNIEVLCAKPGNIWWVPASNGSVPPEAISGGKAANGETLYIGRASYQLSVAPGKIQPSHNSCFITFAGIEVTHTKYDVLCRYICDNENGTETKRKYYLH